MPDDPTITGDEINAAFRSNAVLEKPDDQLLEYLRFLCSQQIGSDPNRLLANNRCITINTILTKRFMEQAGRVTNRLAGAAVALAFAGVTAAIIQVVVALRG